jgi:hypothetical protein
MPQMALRAAAIAIGLDPRTLSFELSKIVSRGKMANPSDSMCGTIFSMPGLALATAISSSAFQI